MMIMSGLMMPAAPVPTVLLLSVALLSAASLLLFAAASVEWLDARD